MRKTALALGVVLALVAGQAMAQAQRSEVSAFVSVISSKTDDASTTTTTIANATYGYYLTPQLVGTLGITSFFNETEGESFTGNDVEVGAKYYFGAMRKGAFVPFVDAAVGIAAFSTEDTSDSNVRLRVGGGGSYFLTESTSIDPSISLFRVATDPATTGVIFLVRFTTRF